MMKIISKYVLLSSAFSLVMPMTAFASLSSAYASLVDTSQNQTFESEPAYLKLAGVYFITNDKGQVFGLEGGDNEFKDDTPKRCKDAGYNLTSCPKVGTSPADICPYDSSYFKSCCSWVYKYTQCDYPLVKSSESCGGKYKCVCDPAAYPYASCNAPRIKGEICNDNSGSHYSSCTCPEGVPTEYGCRVYYAAPCNSVCKTAYSDNCHNRNAVAALYGCQKYYADCSSKCEIAYPDNCRNRTAVSVPANAQCSAYFSDCSSKCSAWACKDGYKKSGDSCESNQAPILYGDGTVSKDILSGKTPIGVVFDETNRLALALTDVKQDGSVGSEKMNWSNQYYDIPSLTNCDDLNTAAFCSVDGRANTDKILACGSSCGGTPAATAVNNYEPAGCMKDFCKKTKWFLPSIRDYTKMYSYKSQIEDSLTLLKSAGAVSLREGDHWSSNEVTEGNAWDFTMIIDMIDANLKKYGGVYVRPVVKY